MSNLSNRIRKLELSEPLECFLQVRWDKFFSDLHKVYGEPGTPTPPTPPIPANVVEYFEDAILRIYGPETDE